MSQYVDIQLLNCNKSASIEERTDDTENKPTGIWTNQLNQTVELNVGDVVTVENALINDVGAGQQQPIEFPGQTIQNTYDVIYTDITPSNPIYDTDSADYRLGIDTKFVATRKQETFPLKPNEANITIGYYINTSEHPEYICHPRRWVQKNYFNGATLFFESHGGSDTLGRFNTFGSSQFDPAGEGKSKQLRDNWDSYPDASTGLCIDEPLSLENYCIADWIEYPIDGTDTNFRLKMVLKNERFTMYVCHKVLYKDGILLGSNRENFWARTIFVRYLELKTIKVDSGFNTPSSIAEQITTQLNEEDDPVDFEVFDNQDNPHAPANQKSWRRKLCTTIKSATYKPINCANWEEGQEAYYDDFMDNPVGVSRSKMNKYYSSMTNYIGVKRPEIWDAGRYTADGGGVVSGIPLQPTISNNGNEGNFIPQQEGYDGIGMYNDVISLADDPVNDPGENMTDPLILQMEYTKENLLALKKLFDAQALYPELWTSIDKLPDYDEIPAEDITHKNSRFVHINRFQSFSRPTNVPAAAETQIHLGHDNLGKTAGTQNKCSHALFFGYDDQYKDTYFDPMLVDYNLDNDNPKLTYGFAQAVLTDAVGTKPDGPGYARTHLPNDPPLYGAIWLIALRVDRAGGFPKSLFTELTPVGYPGATPNSKCIRYGRRCVYDCHSTAYGTCIISPYSGISPFSYVWDTDLLTNNETPQSVPLWSTSLQSKYNTIIKHYTDASDGSGITSNLDSVMRYATQLYMGANHPKISYDQETNRFSFEELHTPNNVANDVWCTGNPKLTEYPINPEQSNIVYKVNPIIPRYGFSPEFMPYSDKPITVHQPFREAITSNGEAEAKKVNLANSFTVRKPNLAIQQNTIFDSHGGIYIDGWGFDKESWDGSLWDIMGFSYEQLNGEATESNVLTKRTTNKNSIKCYRLTTSSDIVSTDLKNRVMNPYQAGFFTNQIAYPTNLFNWKCAFNMMTDPVAPDIYYNGTYTIGGFGFDSTSITDGMIKSYPPFIQPTKSIKITADGLCRAMLKPYFNIHSSIISEANSIGGGRYSVGSVLPIIAICNKYSAQGDYFFSSSDLSFTITKKQVFSDIVTEIRNPDGTLADVDRGCAVIYKIIRQKAAPVDIIAQMLEELQKSKK